MKTNKLVNIVSILFLVTNFSMLIYLINFSNKVVNGIHVGGLALVDNLSQIVDAKIALSNGDSMPVKELTKNFYVFRELNNESYMLLSKRDDNIVYYIDSLDLVYYDKINYKLKYDLKIGYRLEFDNWLENRD